MYENYKSEESKCVECVSKQKAPYPYPIVTPQGLQLLLPPMVKICLMNFQDQDKSCRVSSSAT